MKHVLKCWGQSPRVLELWRLNQQPCRGKGLIALHHCLDAHTRYLMISHPILSFCHPFLVLFLLCHPVSLSRESPACLVCHPLPFPNSLVSGEIGPLVLLIRYLILVRCWMEQMLLVTKSLISRMMRCIKLSMRSKVN